MFGIPVPTLIVIMASLGAVMTVVAIALPFITGAGQASRLKTITRTRQQLSRQQMDGLQSKGSAIRQRQKQSRVEAGCQVRGDAQVVKQGHYSGRDG